MLHAAAGHVLASSQRATRFTHGNATPPRLVIACFTGGTEPGRSIARECDAKVCGFVSHLTNQCSVGCQGEECRRVSFSHGPINHCQSDITGSPEVSAQRLKHARIGSGKWFKRRQACLRNFLRTGCPAVTTYGFRVKTAESCTTFTIGSADSERSTNSV